MIITKVFMQQTLNYYIVKCFLIPELVSVFYINESRGKTTVLPLLSLLCASWPCADENEGLPPEFFSGERGA